MRKKAAGERVYRFIRNYIEVHGYPPDLNEIAQACELTASMVAQELYRLEMRGRIRRRPAKPRGIWLTEKKTHNLSFPVH